MGIETRLNKLEKLLSGNSCPTCIARESASFKDAYAWMAAFLAKCQRCNRQNTWVDLVLLSETYTGK